MISSLSSRTRDAKGRTAHGRRRAMLVVSVTAVILAAVVSTTAQSATKANTITIGNITTLTGGAAPYGISTTAGAQQAIDEVNAAGGVKVGGKTYKLNLNSLDDTGDPTRGVASLKQLTASGSIFIVGPAFGSVSKALLAQMDATNALLTITGGPVDPALLGTHKNTYQTQLSPPAEALAAAWFAGRYGKFKKVALLVDDTSTFDASDFPAGLQAAASKYGFNIITTVHTAGISQVDYAPQLLSLANQKPDLVISAQAGPENALIVKQARQRGYDWPILCTSGAPLLEFSVAGAAINGTFDIVGVNLPALANQKVAQAVKIQKDYAAKNSGQTLADPGSTFTNAYTAVYAYVAAMRAAGTVSNVAKLETAMNALKLSSLPKLISKKFIPQRGKLGTLYDTNHAANTQVAILRWTKGVPQRFTTYNGQG
jgi:branched-chain amino acid transport system substrate-binding protein